MAEIKVVTYKSVDEALQKKEFYAINTSDLGGNQRKGQLVLGIKTSDGAIAKIVFPPTWVPVDLSQFATYEDIGSATTVRDYVRGGLITLITKESYEQMLKIPSYKQEFERVFKKSLSGTSEKSISITSGVATVAPTLETNIVESPITANILSSSTDQELIERFDSSLAGISLGELKALSAKAPVGSVISLVSAELEGMLLNGGLNVKSITELESYKDVTKRGISVEPTISF